MTERDDDGFLTKRAPEDGAERVRVTGANIVVIAGPDVGAEVAIGPAGVSVGTGEGCDLRLSDKLVSRRHVWMSSEPGGVRVVDRASRNGTYFAGAKLHEMRFAESATIVLGETTLKLQLLAEPLTFAVSARTRFGRAIAESPAMRHVFELLERAARSDVTVLLEGDSGTGKDVLANAIHEESPRKEGPFVVVDCGAIPAHLVESELFGHERGAFTGAVSARAGAFEQANGGTLFLDEIGELPIEAQPKLLRALENRSFRRVGGSQTVRVNVRVVAATNKHLREAVRKKEFREDLFYRLAVVHVSVPRLADRPEDVVPLAESFLRRATGDPSAKVPAELRGLLGAYSWPGNARELRNVMERFATFGRADARELFGSEERSGAVGSAGSARFDLASLDGRTYHEAKRQWLVELHRTMLPRAVARAGGNVPRAAEDLGLPKASLYRMLNELRDDDADRPSK